MIDSTTTFDADFIENTTPKMVLNDNVKIGDRLYLYIPNETNLEVDKVLFVVENFDNGVTLAGISIEERTPLMVYTPFNYIADNLEGVRTFEVTKENNKEMLTESNIGEYFVVNVLSPYSECVRYIGILDQLVGDDNGSLIFLYVTNLGTPEYVADLDWNVNVIPTTPTLYEYDDVIIDGAYFITNAEQTACAFGYTTSQLLVISLY